MLINGINILDTYGAILTDGYKYTPPEVSISHFKGRRTSFYQLLECEAEMGKLNIPIVFKGDGLRSITERKSSFDALIYPKVEIQLEDGFMYTSILSKIGDAQYIGRNAIKSIYEFRTLRHKPMVETRGNELFCDFTYPYVACDIEVTVGADATNYVVGTVTFPSVTAGQKLEIDGINGRILVNGAPGAQFAEWIEFPTLVPGENNIECADIVTVRYYPTYM